MAHAQGIDGAKSLPAEAAKQAKDPADGLRGQWHRNGPGFVCGVHTRQKLTPSPEMADKLSLACLHMGPLIIRGDAGGLDARFGAPSRTLPQPNGATARLYFIENPGQLPYLVVTVANDRIVALQISGRAPAKDFSFNGINLGDSAQAVLDRFGPPQGKAPSSLKDTEAWGYGVWPFSFEINQNRVVSIRIHEPGK